MPTLGQLTAVNAVETRFSIMLMNEPVAGLELMPAYRGEAGPGITGTFWKYEFRDLLRSGDTKRADDGVAKEVKWKPVTDTYKTEENAKREWIRDITAMNADRAFNLQRKATIDVTNELLLGIEIAIAAIATSTAILTQNVTLSGTSQLSDFTNSDPLDVFSDSRLALKRVPYNNRITPGELIAVTVPEVIEILRQHPDLQARFGNTDGMLSLANLAEIMGVNRIVVASAWKDTANDAAAAAVEARVWNKDIVFAYVNPNLTEETMTFGATVFSPMPETQGVVEGMADGVPLRIRDYRQEEKGGGGFWREADAAYKPKVILPELAYLVKNAVA